MAAEAATTSSSSASRSLQDSPSWALAAVFFLLIAVSLVLEYSIHLLDTWLQRRRKKALSDAVEKLKSELMLVGFLSILLAVTQKPISNICIPTKVADTMLPCHRTNKITNNENSNKTVGEAAAAYGHCDSKGMVSLMSQDGILQLHIFIFVLAAVHVVFSVFTMALGSAKMKRWKVWEKETQTTEYQVANDPNRFRYTRQTTFGKRHMNLRTETSIHLWIKCFFRQFFHSVAKVDYHTLRHAFITTHNSSETFNFQKYIQRSLEDDFKTVVGISPPLWLVVVAFLLIDVHGWNIYLWLSFVPLIIVLLLGAKLEVIVTSMALRLKKQSSVHQGVPLVQPNDELFWFGHPKFLLHFLHLTLFLNAFEFGFFIWTLYEFGVKSCYHENIEIIITRVVLAVVIQALCSYITLPLYALITQMGSSYKSSILEEQTTNALKKWHKDVRRNMKKQKRKQGEDQEQSHSGTTSVYDEDSMKEAQVSSPRLYHSPTLTEMVRVPKNAQEIVPAVEESLGSMNAASQFHFQ